MNPDSHYLITHHQSCKNSISPHHIFVQLAQVLVTEITSPCDLVFQKCCFNRLLPQSAVAGLTISHEKKEIEKKHLSNKMILYWPRVHQQKYQRSLMKKSSSEGLNYKDSIHMFDFFKSKGFRKLSI